MSVASSMVFRPGACGGPLVVAEIGVVRAGGEDQVVEGNAPAFGDHLAPSGVDAGDLAQHHIDVLRCSRRMPRIGDAISAGDRPAVAT